MKMYQVSLKTAALIWTVPIGLTVFNHLPRPTQEKFFGAFDNAHYWVAKKDLAYGFPIDAAKNLDDMGRQPYNSEEFNRTSAAAYYQAAEAFLKKGNKQAAADSWDEAQLVIGRGQPVMPKTDFQGYAVLDKNSKEVGADKEFAVAVSALKGRDCDNAADHFNLALLIGGESYSPTASDATATAISDCLDDHRMDKVKSEKATHPINAQQDLREINDPSRFREYARVKTTVDNASDDIHWADGQQDKKEGDFEGAQHEFKKIVDPSRFVDFKNDSTEVNNAVDDRHHDEELSDLKAGDAGSARDELEAILDPSRFPDFANESVKVKNAADDVYFENARQQEQKGNPEVADNNLIEIEDPSRFPGYVDLKAQIDEGLQNDTDDRNFKEAKADLQNDDLDEAKKDLATIKRPERIKGFEEVARAAGFAFAHP